MSTIVRQHSLNKLLRYARADKLGAMIADRCMYHTPDRSRFCAVGCLLTPKQHDFLDRASPEANTGWRVASLIRELSDAGLGHLAEQTGLTDEEMYILQVAHDAAYRIDTVPQFIEALERIVREGYRTVVREDFSAVNSA